MPYLSVRLRDRSFNPTRGDEAPYKLVPKRYTKSVIGGCKDAEIQVTGGASAVWEAIDFLRYDVQIRDSTGESVWWGYVNSVEISVGQYKFGVTLDTMGNFVAIAYGRVLPGSSSSSTRATTAYASDAVSISTYGTKERLLSLSSASDDAALNRRDQELAANKLPVPLISWAAGSDNEVRATLTCKGWWNSLDWRYASQPADVVQHTETNGDEVFSQLRNDAANTRVAQSFASDPINSWSAGSVQMRMRRHGSPAITVHVDLQTDSAGSPSGVSIGSTNILSTAFDSSVNWIVADLSGSGVALTPATTYWIVLTIGTGTTDGSNYIEVEASKFNVYTSGTGKVFNGSWALPSLTDAYDYLFIVSGVRETTRMMSDIVTIYGQFIISTFLPTASVVYTNAYLDGDSTAREELETLMDIGSAALVRYISDVDINRVLTFNTEPLPTILKYYLNAEGRIFNQYQVEIPARNCPVGYWAKLDGVVPSTANISSLADPSLVFIEEAEYDVDKDLYIPHPRSLGSVWSQLGKVRRL